MCSTWNGTRKPAALADRGKELEDLSDWKADFARDSSGQYPENILGMFMYICDRQGLDFERLDLEADVDLGNARGYSYFSYHASSGQSRAMYYN